MTRDVEEQIKAAGSTVPELLHRAEIYRSTWQRWKRGDHAPQMTVWQRVLDAMAAIKAEAGRRERAA